MRRFAVASVTVALAAVSAVACSAEGEEEPDGNDLVPTASDVLTVGVKFDQPGIGLRDDSGHSGLDVDVAAYIADRLGYEAEEIVWVESVSAERETMLREGTVDMIVASYSITDERREDVDFAGPYLVTHQDLLVLADEEDITGPESLDERVLCSAEGSTSAERVRQEHSQGVRLYPASTYSECVDLLVAGTVDAVLTDEAILAGYQGQPEHEGRLRVVGEPFSEERYGIGLPPGSDLCEPITAALSDLIADGTWERIVAENLGENYAPSPESNPPEPEPCE